MSSQNAESSSSASIASVRYKPLSHKKMVKGANTYLNLLTDFHYFDPRDEDPSELDFIVDSLYKFEEHFSHVPAYYEIVIGMQEQEEFLQPVTSFIPDLSHRSATPVPPPRNNADEEATTVGTLTPRAGSQSVSAYRSPAAIVAQRLTGDRSRWTNPRLEGHGLQNPEVDVDRHYEHRKPTSSVGSETITTTVEERKGRRKRSKEDAKALAEKVREMLEEMEQETGEVVRK